MAEYVLRAHHHQAKVTILRGKNQINLHAKVKYNVCYQNWDTLAVLWPSGCLRCSSAQPCILIAPTPTWRKKNAFMTVQQAMRFLRKRKTTDNTARGNVLPHHSSGFLGFFNRDFSNIALARVSWPTFSSSLESKSQRGMEPGHFFSCKTQRQQPPMNTTHLNSGLRRGVSTQHNCSAEPEAEGTQVLPP